MDEILQGSLEPAVFWAALSAMATLLAVVVALLAGPVMRRLRINRIEKLIRAEVDSNLEKVRAIHSGKGIQLPFGATLTPLQRSVLLARNMDLTLWHQYRFELAADRPVSYAEFELINRCAEKLMSECGSVDEANMEIWGLSAMFFMKRYQEAFDKKRPWEDVGT